MRIQPRRSIRGFRFSSSIMFKFTHFLIALFLLALAFPVSAGEKQHIDSLLTVLDKAIEERHTYISEKESELKKLRSIADNTRDLREKFNAIGKLLDAYTSFNADSTISICRERESLAQKIGECYYIVHAKLNTANILGLSGMYYEAISILDSIPRNEIPQDLTAFLYHIRRTIYGNLHDYAKRPEDREKYFRLTSQYRDSLISVNDPKSIYRYLIQADQLNVENKPAEGAALLNKWLESNADVDFHTRAIVAFTLADSYRRLGDEERRKEQLAIAAIADMCSAVKEHAALQELALILYDEGDIKHAHDYLRQSLEDATTANARLRMMQISDIFPKVNAMYLRTIKDQQTRLRIMIFGMSLLTLIVLIALVTAIKMMGKARRARGEADEANEKLVEANSVLKDHIEQLREANREIAEESRVKEGYIAGYMGLCSTYIDKIDSLQKKLSLKLGSNKEIKAILNSSSIVDLELKSFYENFDHTFLKLFPTFVADFNRLLIPDQQIWPKETGRLTTELRIFALIRLGVKDSAKIARFLRYSLSTIYNYRTRVRNKAIGNRDLLEEQLMEIKSSSATT